MTEILFVCTGNTCRSAMAEGIFNAMAAQRSLPAHASSCGLAAFPGDPAAPHAVSAVLDYGADLIAHRARRAEASLLERADRILCMTRGHLARLLSDFPECGNKVALLDSGEIPDPWGGDADTYRRTAATIARAVETLLDEGNEELNGL